VTPSAAGISNTTNPTGQTRFENRFKLLNSLDSSLRTNAPNGAEMSDYNEFYIDAKQLMYNPEVNRYFGYTAARSAEFGSTATGNAMLVASQVLKADLGTRFIQITSNDGWDMHSNIYLPVANPLIQARAKIIDDGLSALINDLKANGTSAGRCRGMASRPDHGSITAQGGRDHWPPVLRFAGGVREGDWTDRRTGSRHCRLRLVGETLRYPGYRGDVYWRSSTGPRYAATTRWGAVRVCPETGASFRRFPVHGHWG
jgi:hypothetical protein